MGEASRRKKAGSYPEKTAKAAPDGGDCLEWKVIGDLADHPKGSAVVDALVSLNESMNHSLGGKTMAVLLESVEGKPILAARAVGMAAWVSLLEVFQDLDLNDRLEHETTAVNGYDAIFS